ncbi:hypothetical protein AVEN_149363-1 [Araneus ventricosus]|uniref:Uncharacterized protein n=1 Tax=Araneus ventricosus TaxID=182803 RepID=A0A4Y2X9U1_ARAVE|nr:hypothetical protein AVEN_149363-1 [Araneus ventricosus]
MTRRCAEGAVEIGEKHAVHDVKSKLGPKMRIQYSLYIGDDKDIVHTISLRVPENITVFEIMQLAEKALQIKYAAGYSYRWGAHFCW